VTETSNKESDIASNSTTSVSETLKPKPVLFKMAAAGYHHSLALTGLNTKQTHKHKHTHKEKNEWECEINE
jgi:hypothetical protein